MSTYTAIFEGAADGAIWGWVPEIPERRAWMKRSSRRRRT